MSELRKVLGRDAAKRTYSCNGTMWLQPRQNIGVEIEVEKVEIRERGIKDLEAEASLWKLKNDGSLRNGGKEFTTTGEGLFGDDLEAAIEQFFKLANKYQWESSERTGIHIHLDVSDMDTQKDFYFLCILYAYFERVLFRFVGLNRDTSTFCLPWYKARKSLTMVQKVCRESSDSVSAGLVSLLEKYQDEEKYSALNIGSLCRYGTIEFRHLANEMDKQKLITWINLIMSLKESAARYSTRFEDTAKLLDYLLSANPRLVMQDVFRGYAVILDYDAAEVHMKDCIKVIYDLIYLGETKLTWDYKPQIKTLRGTGFGKFLKKVEKSEEPIKEPE